MPKGNVQQMTVTVSGVRQGLATGSALLTGTVGGNSAPALSSNSAVNNLNRAAGAALAPGTVAELYGGGLSPSTSLPNLLPLPTAFNGTSVLVGAFLAPLYSVSDGQVDIQIPTEAQPNRQYSVLVSNSSAFTLPDTITTTDVSPGLFTQAEHADGSIVTSDSPAKAGDTILLYLVGMGATTPSIPSGTPAPSGSFATVANQPTVTINNETADISFAGLTPGAVGLYQINVNLPQDTPSGSTSITVTQNGVASNTITIPVQ